MSLQFDGSDTTKSSSSQYFQNLKDNSNDLKKTAMKEGKALCDELGKHISELEIAANLERPKTFLGRIFTPMKQMKVIDAEKVLINDITVLQKKLDKTDDITQIFKLTQKILDKIQKLDPTNPHATTLSTKIGAVRAHYQTNMPTLLSTLEKRVAAISQSTHPNSIGVVKRSNTSEKIAKLVKISSKKGGINLSILPVLEIFTSADKVDKELAKMEKIHSILSYPQTEIGKVGERANELNNLIENFKASNKHVLKPFKEEIAAKLNAINEVNTPFPKLTLKQATKLVKINEDLIKLNEDYIQFTTDYQAADAAYQKLNGEAYAVSYQSLTNALSAIPTLENDLFSENVAKRNLEKTKMELARRQTDLKDNYLKNIAKAKTASDFKKIADSINQLVADTSAAEEVGVALKEAIAAHSKVWTSKTGDGFLITHDELDGVNPSKVKLMKLLFNKKTASLKELAKKDLKTYISNLQEMTEVLENITKESEVNLNKLEQYKSNYPNNLISMSQRLEREKQIINEGIALEESLNKLNQKREVFLLIKLAKTQMDVINFPWEKQLLKFEQIQKGMELIGIPPSKDIDLTVEPEGDDAIELSGQAVWSEEAFNQWKNEMLEI